QALCGPSRTSFLTSRRPDTTKLYDVHSYWRTHAGNFTSLPQYFKEHGYHTVSAGKVFHPGIVSNHSDDQPYSWSEVPYHPPTQAYKQTPVCLGSDGGLHTNIYCPVEISEQPGGSLPDIQTTEYVTHWLEEKAKLDKVSAEIQESKPFFIAVGYHKPHIPLKFPVEYLDFYPLHTVPLAPNNYLPKGMPSVAWNPWNDLRRREDIVALDVPFPYGPIPRSYERYIRQGYYAATTYIDSLIGRLIRTARKLFPNTIVALIGDHGWSLGEHQEWSKYSNFEVSTRVPIIISNLEFNSIKIQRESDISVNEINPYNTLLHTLYKKQMEPNFKPFQNVSVRISNNHKEGNKEYRFKQCADTLRSENQTLKLSPLVYDGLVELVDLFPTLVDLAGLPFIPSCSVYSMHTKTCTEGRSLAPLISSVRSQISYEKKKTVMNYRPKKAVFSQYPRPGINPSVKPDSDQPRASEIKIMGYSMRTHRYRYTVWLRFNNVTYEPDWSYIYAEELYDHKVDENENHNVCGKDLYKLRKKRLHWQLLKGWQRA
ncbi:hypothetical protein SK128_018164, partial [Halocaridina rubra]